MFWIIEIAIPTHGTATELDRLVIVLWLIVHACKYNNKVRWFNFWWVKGDLNPPILGVRVRRSPIVLFTHKFKYLAGQTGLEPALNPD
jgi:hypothetical protein